LAGALNITELTLAELSHEISSGSLSPVSVVEAFLTRIEELNPHLNAYISTLRESARKEASKSERELREGKRRGPLHGIPISLKDNIVTRGIRTTAGSKILSEWIPNYDAAIVEKLRAKGAILMGKTNLDELAMGPSTINPFFGTTRNPWDLDRIAGGSSGGSASAVAASLCVASVGTDAAGSVRIPASLCNIVGLKPTFGRIPRHGIVQQSGYWSLDTVGQLTKTAEDAGILLSALAGQDSRDKESFGQPSLGSMNLDVDLNGMKAGVLQQLMSEVSEDVRKQVQNSVKLLERLGMVVEDVSVDHLHYASIIWSVIGRVESWASNEDYVKSRPQDYSRGLLGRVLLGKFISGSHYLRAQRARDILIHEFESALKKFDCLIAPTTPIPAPTIEEYQSGDLEVNGTKHEEGGIFLATCTLPLNLTGHPVVSVPCGLSPSGLPLGLQIIGKAFDEVKILGIAHKFEKGLGRLVAPVAERVRKHQTKASLEYLEISCTIDQTTRGGVGFKARASADPQVHVSDNCEAGSREQTLKNLSSSRYPKRKIRWIENC
jgi:aspartyl-tRNA(Asn)/glutamyl-tRNA(Gln) amidotransferase subunit A